VAIGEESLNEIRADEARSTGDEDIHITAFDYTSFVGSGLT
jgi:hypothetical protein